MLQANFRPTIHGILAIIICERVGAGKIVKHAIKLFSGVNDKDFGK